MPNYDNINDKNRMGEAAQTSSEVEIAADTEENRQSLDVIESSIHSEDSPHTSGDSGIPMLGIRNDTDTFTADEGDYSVLKLDEQGRLKVSSKPASYPDIVGNITAAQTVISTPVVGGTVTGDVSRASNIMVFCTGTFAGVNCIFEGSLEATGETNWFGVQAIRTNANTIETTTGVLAAQPVYAWEASVNALKRFRVRATAFTSGTQAWRFVQGTYATEPIPGAQVSATQPVSGTVTATVANATGTNIPSTAQGSSTNSVVVSAATVNNTLIKATVGVINHIIASNNSASWRYLKIYNKATAPVAGTDVPVQVIGLPPGSNQNVSFAPFGLRITLGIGIAITAGIANTDTTVVGANEVQVSISYT